MDLPRDNRNRSLWGESFNKISHVFLATPCRRWITVGTAAMLLVGVICAGLFFTFYKNGENMEIAKNTPPNENARTENSGGGIPAADSLNTIQEKTEKTSKTGNSPPLDDPFTAFPDLTSDLSFTEMRTNDIKKNDHREISPGSGGGKNVVADTKSGNRDPFDSLEKTKIAASGQKNPDFDDIFAETPTPVKPRVTEITPREIPAPKTVSVPDMRNAKIIPLESLPVADDWRKTDKNYTLGETLAETPNFDSRDILAPADFLVAEEMPRGRDSWENPATKTPAPHHEINVHPKTETPPRPTYPVFTDSAPGFAKTEKRSETHAEKTYPRADVYSKYENAEHAHAAAKQGKISEDTVYVALKGENYSNISEKAYGTGSYARAIALYNNVYIDGADFPAAGTVVYLPEENFLRKCYPTLCPETDSREMLARNARAGNTEKATPEDYVIRAGDSLPDIAKTQLGSAARWTELYHLNRDVLGTDVDRLTPGVRLRLPENSGIIATHREDGTGYR